MAIAPLNEVYSWVVSTLEGDSTLNTLGFNDVYMHQAPEGASRPYFIVQKQTGNYNFVLDKGRAFDRHWIAIKTVTPATSSSGDGGAVGRTAMERARELIAFGAPSLSTGKVLDIRENSAFEYREAEIGGLIFYHVGTVFVFSLAH